VVLIKQIAELLEVGIYETITPEKTMTIRDLIKELNLEEKDFGILVDGKKADLDTKVEKNSEVVILPHIAGGK
jgi:sulfur carrier protein ThiS